MTDLSGVSGSTASTREFDDVLFSLGSKDVRYSEDGFDMGPPLLDNLIDLSSRS
jgi:hypothetical protein